MMTVEQAAKVLAATIADDAGSLGGYKSEQVANGVAEALTVATGEQWRAVKALPARTEFCWYIVKG